LIQERLLRNKETNKETKKEKQKLGRQNERSAHLTVEPVLRLGNIMHGYGIFSIPGVWNSHF